ncbi:MAG: cell division protein ZapD [Pseudomonadota bacterium]
MVTAAEQTGAHREAAVATYEQPLNERMRTFLRLEFLYRQTEYHVADNTDMAARKAIDGLLEIVAILARGDVRSEVMKELERQIDQLRCFARNPDVDGGRLQASIDEVSRIRESVNAIGTHYLQPLKDNEFLSAIKHRSAIPGGTCEFDLPLFSHWLRRPYEARREDIDSWLQDLRPLCGAVKHIMWLIRQTATASDCVAESGMYQHAIARDSNCRMLRVQIAHAGAMFPEVSGSPQRFTIRFMVWQGIEHRPSQTREDVPFRLYVC